jgi:hypothetical protein
LVDFGKTIYFAKRRKQVFNYLCGTTLDIKEDWSCDDGADGTDTAERKTQSTKLKAKTKQF